jgi:hypothetical protein
LELLVATITPLTSPLPSTTSPASKEKEKEKEKAVDTSLPLRPRTKTVDPQALFAESKFVGIDHKKLDATFASFDPKPGLIRQHHENRRAWAAKWSILNQAVALGKEARLDSSYFTIEQDPYGKAFLGQMYNVLLKGGRVDLMMDWQANAHGKGFTTMGLGRAYLLEMAKKAAEAANGSGIYVYNQPWLRQEYGLTEIANGILSHLTNDKDYVGTPKPTSSNHDKNLTLNKVDKDGNLTGICHGNVGGTNIGRPYYQTRKDNPEKWNDSDAEMECRAGDPSLGQALLETTQREINGDAASKVGEGLDHLYKATATADLGTELLVYAQLMEQWMNGEPLSEAQKTELRKNKNKGNAKAYDQALAPLANELLGKALSAVRKLDGVPEEIRSKKFSSAELERLNESAVELVRDLDLKGFNTVYAQVKKPMQPAHIAVLDKLGAASTDYGQQSFDTLNPGLKAIADAAVKQIAVKNPYVVLTTTQANVFEAAARRGVENINMTNSWLSTDSAITQAIFMRDWPKMQERSDVDFYTFNGVEKQHAKTFAVDGGAARHGITGITTYNADFISEYMNGEMGVVFQYDQDAKLTTDDDILSVAYTRDLSDKENFTQRWFLQTEGSGKVKKDAAGNLLVENGVRLNPNNNFEIEQFVDGKKTKLPQVSKAKMAAYKSSIGLMKSLTSSSNMVGNRLPDTSD